MALFRSRYFVAQYQKSFYFVPRMPRSKNSKPFRRVQLRISESLLGIFDAYTSNQVSELVEWALANYLPGSALGPRQISIIRPQKPQTKTICRLSVYEKQIKLLFPEKLDLFRSVVKSYGFSWEPPFWQKVAKEAQLCDRAAEISRALLDAGFAVQTEYAGITVAALESTYAPESLRLISARASGVFKGWLAIRWPRGEDYYSQATQITAAKYNEGEVLVPPEHFEEVLDFANIYDFSVTPEAESEIQTMRQALEIGYVPSKKQRRQRAEKPVEIEGIPEELRDED